MEEIEESNDLVHVDLDAIAQDDNSVVANIDRLLGNLSPQTGETVASLASGSAQISRAALSAANSFREFGNQAIRVSAELSSALSTASFRTSDFRIENLTPDFSFAGVPIRVDDQLSGDDVRWELPEGATMSDLVTRRREAIEAYARDMSLSSGFFDDEVNQTPHIPNTSQSTSNTDVEAIDGNLFVLRSSGDGYPYLARLDDRTEHIARAMSRADIRNRGRIVTDIEITRTRELTAEWSMPLEPEPDQTAVDVDKPMGVDPFYKKRRAVRWE